MSNPAQPNAPILAQCAALLCAAESPVSINQLAELCGCERQQLEPHLETLKERLQELGLELVQIASGLRVQTRAEHADLVVGLFKGGSPRFTRATLETLALIAYRQPITRGEIEHIRSVSVSGNIIRSLTERGWIRIIGHRDVPGKPALYGTSSSFLDYFNLKSLAQLPVLPDIKSIEDIDTALADILPPDALAAKATGADTDAKDTEASAQDSQPLH